MHPQSRRSYLRWLGTVVAGGCLGSFAGCFGWSGTIQPGTLVILNDQNQPHLVQVVALDDPYPPDRAAASSTPTARTPTPPWQRGVTIEVPAGETVEQPDFVTEPGRYEIYARLDTGVTAMVTNRFNEAAGEGVTGAHIVVSIYEDGRLSMYTPYDE